MTLEETETSKSKDKPVEETKTDPKIQAVLTKLDDEVTTNYSSEFDQMVHSNEWSIEGELFHYQMPNHKRLGQLRALQAMEIDEQKDWNGYGDNYFKRAELLMKEMTREKFDELPFYSIENLVTAWSVRSNRGFRSGPGPAVT